jgi:ring-1,2-phenylacetyl-CoA epoxidase subunit PaaB
MPEQKNIISLDPRMNRIGLPVDFGGEFQAKEELDQLPTYEVFHQQKSGAHHVHVGSVHAATSELAISYAKEQYSRRGQTHNLWVVPTEAIVAFGERDGDIFETTPEKTYREVNDYVRVREKIERFKQETK